ncbi:MAG: efflux RND transporter periplasmic adaptor subunit [Candidatus Buchananbacteria bacterium]
MLKIFKKKRFWIILIIILAVVGFGIYKLASPKPAVEYTTETVKRGKLTQTVSATGQVESAHEITLNFKTPGKITYLGVKEGDNVKAGQDLARIDSGSIAALIKQYQANLASAQANLEKVKAGASVEDIKLTQEQLTKTQNDYNNLVRESKTQVDILKDKTIDSLNNAVFTSQTALNTVYRNLINTETTVSMIVMDIDLQNQVKSDYGILVNNLAALRDEITAAQKSYDQQLIAQASDDVKDFLSRLNSYLDSSFNLTDMIIVNTTYTQTKKDTIKSDISTQQTSNNTSLTAVQTARSNLINTADSYQSQILAAANAVSIAQASLDLKKAGPRSFELASAEAAVAQAQASLDKTRADAEDYVIRAPIDGKITQVNYSLGETTAVAEAAIAMLSNERYEIKVDIPESDIIKLIVGEKVTIDLDAFGSDHPFSGAVTFIDPAQTIIKDVTYYKTTVTFNQDSWSDQIKPGMTANITIIAAEKDNALYIPQRAVKVRETTLGEAPKKYVEVLVNGQAQERDVEIGLRGDEGLVEIIFGLNEGEQVVTYKKDNTK